MKLLLLGGPKFVGRAFADATLARGHELTFFNRGRTNADLYPDVERLVGDREADLSSLAGREWDAVVDTSGYVPHVVAASAEALSGSGRYLFVSSVSVYADMSVPVDEESAVAELGELPVDALTPDFSNYGPLKALCEEEARAAFGERALVVRPGLIVGPHDPTGRFTYWPHRFVRGGRVVAPAPAGDPTQFIDVRDLGEWMVDLCEREVAGTFNAINDGVPWSDLLETCRSVAATDAEIVWVPSQFLLEQEVGEWMELPLWVADPEMKALHRVDVSGALAEGLRFRSLEDTMRATLEHAETTEAAGLTPEREAAVLAAWDER